LVVGNLREHAQLYLTKVPSDENTSVGRPEATAITNVAWHLLDVRRIARHSSGVSAELNPTGINPTVGGDVLQPFPTVRAD
jgi:hypothetical protein